MKSLILLLILASNSAASAYPCPQKVALEPEAQELQAWIAAIQGRSAVGDCAIEITVCDPQEEPGYNHMIGEIYVVDGKGREAYLPITLADGEDKLTRTQAKIYSERVSYVKYDYLFEDEYGRTEAYRLDVRLNKDGAIRKLDLGTYSTRKKLNMPNGNQSRWYNCKE